jgi:hypothetical protein
VCGTHKCENANMCAYQPEPPHSLLLLPRLRIDDYHF